MNDHVSIAGRNGPGHTPRAVQLQDVPAPLLALVPGHHYVDVFTVDAPGAAEAAPERWLRTALEGASATGRFLAWQLALGLRLDRRPSPGRIVGWRIVDRGEGWITLAASSWCLTANIVCQVEPDQLLVATFITYDRPVAPYIWTPVSVVHRALMPGLLNAAVGRMERSR